LGRTLRWAEANKDVLVHTQMILGNPHRGEVIGYKHAVGDRTIVFLRNPSLQPQRAAIDFLPPEGDATRRTVEIVYPYRKLLARNADPARPIEVALAPNEMLVIEAMPAVAITRPLVEGCRYAIVSESPKEFVFDLIGEDARPVSARIFLPDDAPSNDAAQPAARGYHPLRTLAMADAPRPLQADDSSPCAPYQNAVETRRYAQPLQVGQNSAGVTPLQNTVVVRRSEGSTGGQFFLVCENAGSALPISPITVNGKPVKAAVLTGERWRTFSVPLGALENTVAWQVLATDRPKTPFAAKSFTMSSYALARRPLPTRRVIESLAESPGPAHPALPTPFAAQATDLVQIQSPREVMTVTPGAPATIAAADLKRIKAARLHLAVFGANPEARYANKPVTLNGALIGILPPNPRHDVDRWAERVMEIPAARLPAITADNAIVVANCGGDCFKFREAALAVELPDGRWVESHGDSAVYCGCGLGGGWLYHEGKGFSEKSPPIQLALPVVP
jgi:hypothetical protein